ncbi:MAG: hypothetical protein ACYTFM_09745 [Planctomycetota bacterium]|jgi:hypothetical protein
MTNAKVEFKVTVYLMSGETLSYKRALDQEEVYNVGSKIENSLKANYLGLEMDGKLTIIPSQQIQKIEIDPAPEVMIAHVVRDVQPLKD